MKTDQSVICFFLLLFAFSCTLEKAPEQHLADTTAIQAVNQSVIIPGTDTLAIAHAQIITGDGVTVIEDGCIIIANSKIQTVGKFEEVTIPTGIAVIDATGKSLLPGLIDAHFHLDNLDSLPSVFLSKGITSVRDPGAWIEAYEQERASGMPLPRLYLTGPHLDMFPPAYPKNSFVLRDPLEAKAAVNRFADQGASAIKIYFRSSMEIIEAVCETADHRGIPVTAHLEVTDIYNAVTAGIDGIEHITSLGTNLVAPQAAEAYKQAILKDNNARKAGRYRSWKTIDPNGEPAERLGIFLEENAIFVCPTLGAFEYQATPDIVDTTRLQGFQNMLAYTKKLHDLGVTIVVGSHSWVRYSEYGWAYHHEMELLEKLGMEPLEIIRAATLDNAKFFRIADRLGTIEAGKIADLILVNGNPLEGIVHLRNVEKVMQAGRWIRVEM